MVSEDHKIKDLIANLNERNKELTLLYQAEELLNDLESDIGEIMEKLVQIIPLGWQYPGSCVAQIEIENLAFHSEGFTRTDLKLSEPIYIEDKKIGTVNVFYIKKIKSEKGIFLPSEKKLIKNIADKISKYIQFKRLKNSIKELEQDSGFAEEGNNLTEIERTREWLRGQHLNEEEINLITKVRIKFKKGENICKQGAITSYIMLLADGLTKNYLEGNQERGFNFKIVKPFDFIGLSSLYGSNTYQF